MTLAVAAAFLGALKPPPRIAPSEWAEQNLVLPQGVSRPGALKLTVPQRGMVDAVAESDAKVIVFMTAAQIGKSTAIDCILANSIVNDPGPTLYVAPDESAAHSYVRDRFDKLIAATPALRAVVGVGAKGVDSKDAKSFPGGELHTASSFKANDLAARSIRLICQDEIDRFARTVPGGEGDPVALAIKRTTAWRNAVTVLSSTPTFKATSRIAAWYERSDKRLFHVACPSCGVIAPLAKERIVFEAGKPEAARLYCLDCGEATDEAGRLNMIRAGSWIATAAGEKGVIGFHANSLISEMESLTSIAQNIDSAKTPDQRRVLTNTTFGEPFESLSELELVPSELQALAIPIAAPYPKAIDFVVAGCDVQTNRLECSYMGVNKATGAKWILDHVVLNGDTSGPTVWTDLDRALARTFELEDKRVIPITASLVDSGFNTGMVVPFVSTQRAKGRRVFASKGVTGFHRQPIVEGAKNRGATHRVMLLGIDGLKINVTKGLTLPVGTPNAIATPDHLQSDYWAQLAAERLDTKITNRGRPDMAWIKTPNQNNEAFDCAVMCCAAALLVKNPAAAVNAPKSPTISLAEHAARLHRSIT
ncbi:MAG: phage terminase large subunit family protein [Xanthobacteraceae bacterium]|nr:phage terminase large subunit family protein [Xanthobacteraceae bacterium]